MKSTDIKVVPTANDDIVKFEADYFLTQHSSHEFNNIDEAKNSPLAQELFHLPFVKRIFIAQNFVAIDKYQIVQWDDVAQEVADQIKEYLNNGGIAIAETTAPKKVPVTVYAESTPNPAVLKFVANKKLVLKTFEFKNINEAKEAPLAQELFHLPFVKEIFMDENYISISKHDTAEWNDITPELREFIRNYLEQGKQIVTDNATASQEQVAANSNQKLENLDDTSKEIVDILEEYVKPAVAGDGGNIMFESYDSNTKVVKVILQGACSGCPSSTVTLKNGIETMLKEMLKGKVESVEAVNG